MVSFGQKSMRTYHTNLDLQAILELKKHPIPRHGRSKLASIIMSQFPNNKALAGANGSVIIYGRDDRKDGKILTELGQQCKTLGSPTFQK